MDDKRQNDKSLMQLSDMLVGQVVEVMRTAKTEEDLRMGVEKALDPVLSDLGIKSHPKYERLGKEAAAVYKGRPDAVHGMVIIEYEAPSSFRTSSVVEHAHGQLVDYIMAEASARKEQLFFGDPKFVGVGFDGSSIFFTKYRGDKIQPKVGLERKDFAYEGPYSFDIQSARTLLTYLRSLSRRPLTAEHLAEIFGPRSRLAPIAVSAFADALENWGSERVKVFFNEWKRLFGIVYGEQIGGRQAKEAAALAALYGVGKETGFQELLFSVHTYFALLMKLIAAELLTLRETVFTSSFSSQLVHGSKGELQRQLTEIENGGVYAKRGISNFLEGDFFRWYLDAFSPRLEEAIRETARGLAEFEPATTALNPESSRDLLKKLYQYLVPQEVRRMLGEYYTPDWLAELLLDEVGYKGNTLKRFLDPACGSGTFLVFAIQRAKEYGRNHREPPVETVKRIINNIWGFDLNPLAALAARTNYIFALGDLVNELDHLEIPIYLADSVLWPERSGQQQLNFAGGDHVRIQTSVKEFHVPLVWIQDRGFSMQIAAPLVEEMVKQSYSTEEAMARLAKAGVVFPPHEDVVSNFYQEVLELEKEGRDGIWARFLKNVFAPMAAGKFDFLVGNPPWIRWGYLSEEYRQATLPLWKNYGLFSLKGHAARLGGGEKDFSMLFTYASADYYLRDGAKLGFLITQEVFKSKGAGEGFRRFQLGEGESLRVIKAHDLVAVQPFEGAANKTAAIILSKGGETKYPLPYIRWERKRRVGRIPTDATLSEAKPMLQRKKLIAQPMGKPTGAWQTFSERQKDLLKIEGVSEYRAHEGGYIVPYGVFWLEVKQVLSGNDLLVSNLNKAGKWKIEKVEEVIEKELVYPAIRGKDIQRWQALPCMYVLVTQDPKLRYGYAEDKMKKELPRTYGYLLRFREVLLRRAMYKKYHAGEKRPFYSQYNIAEYSFAPYRVVWKHMTNDVFAAVISQCKTPFGYKKIVSTHTTSLIGCEGEAEAHYLCAIINSIPVREFIKSFSSAGRGFGAPSVMSHVGITKFDPKNKLHQKLARMSKTLHDLKIEGREAEIDELERQNDELVGRLFGIH